jgi:hypothetical protein
MPPKVAIKEKIFVGGKNPVVVAIWSPRYRIEAKWKELNGAPGKPISDFETVEGGYRIKYENGSIYTRKDISPAVWVYGAIGEKYDSLGGVTSWLGFPLEDEQPFDQRNPEDSRGRVSVFEKGAIYWWPDTGAIELNDVVVHYTGLVCFGETDWDQSSDSDEPYVVFGMVSPVAAASAMRTPVYEDVDAGESRPDLNELYRGKPYGLSISGVLMEHDDDDPDKYKDAIEKAALAAGTTLGAALVAIPALGPALAAIATPILVAVAPKVAGAVNDALDLKDDQLGAFPLILTPKQMVVLAARTPISEYKGVGFKLESPLISGAGASYKVYFGCVPA